MRFPIAVLLVALFAAPGFAWQDSSRTKKSSKAKSSKAKSSATTKRTQRRPSKASARTTKKPAAAASNRRSSQLQPTADRYKEIQQALSAKGYFTGPVDGTWGPSSVDALKRFQRDQNLTEDGKIGSLSLIALGLGPRRVARAEPPPSEKPVPQP